MALVSGAPIDQYPLANWEKIVAVNLTGALNGIQAVPAMKKAGGGRPEEVAKLVVFLASDDSSFSTGPELVVDGPQGMFSEAA